MKIFIGILLFAFSLTLSYGLNLPDRNGGRIVGGDLITIYQVPYQASLHTSSFLCGGKSLKNRESRKILSPKSLTES